MSTTRLISYLPSTWFGTEKRAQAGERQMVLKVFAILPEFRQAVARAEDGAEFALTAKTPGVDLQSLREGQRLSCLVAPRLAKVLKVLA